jgi:deoxyadenosine/deoxycytidine kinase
MKKCQLIVEGTVGSGKTTLGKFLSEYSNIKLYEELSNDDTTILLDKFYADQERWSFALQVHYLNERFKMIKNINKLSTGILDRSIYGDRIFAKMLHEDGKMTNEEYNTYETLLESMLEHVIPPQLTIYLKCSTDTAVKRIAHRNRGIETEVPIKYWLRLNEKYDQWYNQYNKSEKMCLEVDDFNVYDETQRIEYINKIALKIDEINKKQMDIFLKK